MTDIIPRQVNGIIRPGWYTTAENERFDIVQLTGDAARYGEWCVMLDGHVIGGPRGYDHHATLYDVQVTIVQMGPCSDCGVFKYFRRTNNRCQQCAYAACKDAT